MRYIFVMCILTTEISIHWHVPEKQIKQCQSVKSDERYSKCRHSFSTYFYLLRLTASMTEFLHTYLIIKSCKKCYFFTESTVKYGFHAVAVAQAVAVIEVSCVCYAFVVCFFRLFCFFCVSSQIHITQQRLLLAVVIALVVPDIPLQKGQYTRLY